MNIMRQPEGQLNIVIQEDHDHQEFIVDYQLEEFQEVDQDHQVLIQVHLDLNIEEDIPAFQEEEDHDQSH